MIHIEFEGKESRKIPDDATHLVLERKFPGDKRKWFFSLPATKLT